MGWWGVLRVHVVDAVLEGTEERIKTGSDTDGDGGDGLGSKERLTFNDG